MMSTKPLSLATEWFSLIIGMPDSGRRPSPCQRDEFVAPSRQRPLGGLVSSVTLGYIGREHVEDFASTVELSDLSALNLLARREIRKSHSHRYPRY